MVARPLKTPPIFCRSRVAFSLRGYSGAVTIRWLELGIDCQNGIWDAESHIRPLRYSDKFPAAQRTG